MGDEGCQNYCIISTRADGAYNRSTSSHDPGSQYVGDRSGRSMVGETKSGSTSGERRVCESEAGQRRPGTGFDDRHRCGEAFGWEERCAGTVGRECARGRWVEGRSGREWTGISGSARSAMKRSAWSANGGSIILIIQHACRSGFQRGPSHLQSPLIRLIPTNETRRMAKDTPVNPADLAQIRIAYPSPMLRHRLPIDERVRTFRNTLDSPSTSWLVALRVEDVQDR